MYLYFGSHVFDKISLLLKWVSVITAKNESTHGLCKSVKEWHEW